MNQDDLLHLEESPANLELQSPEDELYLPKFQTEDEKYNVWVETDRLPQEEKDYPITINGPLIELNSASEYEKAAKAVNGYDDMFLDLVDTDVILELSNAELDLEPGADYVERKLSETDRQKLNARISAFEGFNDIKDANRYVNSKINEMEEVYEGL